MIHNPKWRRLMLVLTIASVVTRAGAIGGGVTGFTMPQSSASQAQLQEWTRFRVKKEGFSVLLPELPTIISRGRYIRGLLYRNLDVRKYAAYADGVVYQVISFGNPNYTESLDYFEAEIRMDELRDVAIATRTELSNGLQFSFKRYTYDKSSSHPGVAQIYEAKQREFALVAIGKDGNDPSVRRFMQSLELGDQSAGRDIDRGAGIDLGNSGELIDSSVLTPKEVSVKPMVLIKPPPGPYTEEARRHLTRGPVILRVVLSASGRVTNIEVLTSLPYGLTDRAIEAARRIYFIPGMKDGRFVSTLMMLEYRFNIY